MASRTITKFMPRGGTGPALPLPPDAVTRVEVQAMLDAAGGGDGVSVPQVETIAHAKATEVVAPVAESVAALKPSPALTPWKRGSVPRRHAWRRWRHAR